MTRIRGAGRAAETGPTFTRRQLRAGLVPVAGALLVSIIAAQVAAETKSPRPSVEVDLSVLDELAPAGGAAPRAPVTLKPPVPRETASPPPSQLQRAGTAPTTATKTATKTPSAQSSATSSAKPSTKSSARSSAQSSAKPSARSSAPASTQSAARPAASAPEAKLSIPFEEGSAALPDSVLEGLETIVQRLATDSRARLVIHAYAAGTAETASQARRLSLSRALAVRRYLIKKGVRGTRAEIRALGNKTSEAPADRVDLVVVRR